MFARIIKTLCCLALVISFNIAFAKTQKFPIPAFAPDQTAYDGKVVYLLNTSQKKVYRWSVSAADYLAPWDVGIDQQGAILAPAKIAVSSTQKRLYLGYSTGAIRYIPLTGDPIETAFASTPMGVFGLAAVGKYLLAQDYSGAWATHYIYNQAGVLTDSKDWNSYSTEYTWDAKNSRVLYFQDGFSPNSLVYEVVDQATGKISSTGGGINENYTVNLKPIRLSADNKFLLLGNGNIYKNPSLAWVGKLDFQIADAVWNSDGSLVTLAANNGSTLLQRRDSNFRVIDQQTYVGAPIGIFTSGSKTSVLTLKNGLVTPYAYVANDDSDGDGVKNDLDAFPTDAAASLDADKDGYPDKWNSGRAQKDSTTGLLLDAFPKDAACYLKSQGSGSKCNYNLIVPNYVPETVVSDGSTIYLLSKANKRIYRWSIANSTYLSPLSVGISKIGTLQAPDTIALSTDASRLYLGYSSGDIHYITLKNELIEKPFAVAPFNLNLLVDAGKFLIAQPANGWGARYTYNANGAVVAQLNWVGTGNYDWDPSSSRLYSWSGSLGYEQINQASGQVTSSAQSTYYFNQRLIRPSINGKSILVGSGVIIDKASLNPVNNLGFTPFDALWLQDGSLVTLVQGDDTTLLQRRNASLDVVEELNYSGTPVGVFGTAGKMSVVVIKNGTIVTYTYVPNNDADNDGVPNNVDAFPADPAASVDTDRDGFPDMWNQGRTQANSTSGLVLDAYPQDAACYSSAHGVGGLCNHAATVPNFIPDQVLNGGDVVYLFSAVNKRIYRWSLSKGAYIDPLVVGMNQVNGVVAPIKITLSTAHNRLYLGYSNGVIRYIALNGRAEQYFASVSNPMGGLASVGKYLLAQDNSGAWGTHYIFDENGTIKDAQEWSRYSRVFTFDPVTSRVYFFRDNSSPNDLHYEVINQATGEVGESGETPYHGDYNITPPIRVSVDGTRVLLGSGDIYNQAGLTWAASLGGIIADANWLADGSLVSLEAGDNKTILRRRSSNLQVVEQLSYGGVPVGVYGSAEKMVVITIKDGTVATYIYVPSNDNDSDGVDNTLDAFPLDAAASVDSDRDGYPDNWNSGASEADSKSGLVLDAYPQDAACYALSQGNAGGCDYNAAVPGFIPDQVESDGNIIYFLSSANKRVYRWSIADSTYINPLVVGQGLVGDAMAPIRMALSNAHNRLYLGYGTGAITYIEQDTVNERVFTNIAMSVDGLVAVGNYVMAQDSSGAWATHYIFDQNGTQTDSKDWNEYSRIYTWDPVTSRVYFFRDYSSPNDLHYEVIDQSTGKITAANETPYHGAYNITPPIRVSVDGQRVLLGSGDIYNQSALTWAGSLGRLFKDAKWLADGSLVTLSSSNGSTTLQRRSPNLQLLEQLTYEGDAVGVYGTDEKMAVVVIKDGVVASHIYIINNDTDSDGVENTTDAFPTDPAASADSDRDGYPDAWNPGKTESDSNSGLVLDVYPRDAACYELSQGDGGVCNYNAAVPVFTPDKIESDGDVIYLLSSANKRIYRWSVANKTYLNPLVIGLSVDGALLAPTQMSLSLSHNRIYLGYDTGVISYIELDSVEEKPFANTAMSVEGLAVVGNYVLAQDGSGAWSTHYIFDRNGSLTFTKDWDYYSRTYAWDAVNSRVYFFRDDTSPNDLMFEVIDQATGTITAEGETPYHGNYAIMGPIRVTEDGSKVMLGSGDIYSSAGLGMVKTLHRTFVDGQWFGSLIVTVEGDGNVNVWDKESTALLTSLQYEGQPLKLVVDGQDLVLVHLVSGVVTYSQVLVGDHDGDGLPRWWEALYGLNDENPSDASLDTDADGLNNLAEFSQSSNPNDPDSDTDGLNDGIEVNSYHSSPIKADTDGDRLSDSDEVGTYGTNPVVVDTDADSFGDYEEIFAYNSNPNDANSKPAALTSLLQSFEVTSLPANWSSSQSSQSDWYVDSSASFDGAKSIRSGDIGDSQQSGIKFRSVFGAGTLQFYAKLDVEPCCDKLYFYVDGALVKIISQWDASSWTAFSVDVAGGDHEFEWRYVKDSSVSTLNDSVWIDKVTFSTP